MNEPYIEWEDHGFPVPDSFLMLRIGSLRVLIADVLYHCTEEGPNNFIVRPHDASRLLLGRVEPYYATIDEAKRAVESIYSEQFAMSLVSACCPQNSRYLIG